MLNELLAYRESVMVMRTSFFEMTKIIKNNPCNIWVISLFFLIFLEKFQLCVRNKSETGKYV